MSALMVSTSGGGGCVNGVDQRYVLADRLGRLRSWKGARCGPELSAALKNAIDWLSRPYGSGALSGRPTAVVGTAYGQFGGVWAQDEARKALGIAGANVLADAKLSIPGSVVRFAELHPQDDAEVVEQLPAVVAQLAEATAVSA